MKKKKELIALDQGPLIQEAIQNLESWHEKIELLEIEIQKFNETDLKLYNDWHSLTSKDYANEVNALIDQYERLVYFHNWVVFEANDKNISMPHAFHLMTEEEIKFQEGSQIEKEQIAKLRQGRNQKIKLEQEPDFDLEQDQTYEETEDSKDDEQEDPNQGLKIEIELAREKFNKELRYFENLTDKKIIKLMRNFEDGTRLLAECVFICIQCYRFELIEKIWIQTPVKLRAHFNSDFKKQMGMTMEQYLKEIKAEALGSSLSDEDSDAEFDFKAHFENLFNDKKSEISEDKKESARIVYRRIMMKIHPDKLSPDFAANKKAWLDRLWKKIQVAYDRANVQSLQNLHLQVLITLKKYEELDYSELRSGSLLLKKELSRLERVNQDTLEHPAWGFSNLKSYKKLEKVIAEPFKDNAKGIKKEIKRIAKIHETLKMHVHSILARGGFGKSKKTRSVSRRKKKGPAHKDQYPLFSE